MNSSTPLKELLRPTSTADKLNLFQLLFKSSEINTDLALALLKVIHRELVDDQARDRSLYKLYAETIANLRYREAAMLRQIVDAWHKGRTIKDPEWIEDGKIK